MHVFDEVYVYSLENDAFTVRILSMRMNEKTCRKAKDGNVEIIVKKNEKTKLIKKYCGIKALSLPPPPQRDKRASQQPLTWVSFEVRKF